MAIDIQKLSSSAQAIANQLGITKYDVYGSSVDESSVEVDSGEPKQVEASNRSSVMVRVWNDRQTVGVTSTTDLDSSGLELALKTAAEASQFGVTEHAPDFSPEATTTVTSTESTPVTPASAATLIETLVRAEKQLVEAHDAIVSVPYNGLSQRDIERFYLNSEGALRHESGSYVSLYLYSRTEQEGKKPRSAGSFRVETELQKLDIAGCVDEAAEKTISHLEYTKIPSGKYTVVLSPEAFLSLLGVFSNLFNAQSILDNRSLSTPESIGSAIASPLLSVCDDELHAANVGSSYFDDEGTPTRRIPLITEGVLTNFLHSAGTAKRMNAQPTGHASIGAKVSVSPNFMHVFPGASAEKAYSLDLAENVVWIDSLKALHAGVSALEGSFSLPFDGWLVNKGKRVSIDSATVAGDFRDVLKSIIYVEPEVEETPRGVCPKIWVEGLSITSE